MKKILRVFPYKTSYTPDDAMVIIGLPPMSCFIPYHDEVHISCVFSWDREYCLELQRQWQAVTPVPVLIGGPAFGSKPMEFTAGMYVKKGIVFTSRGCNNNCAFCIVPELEGNLHELPIVEGNIIQDNNFLQCSDAHKAKVFEMLKEQKGICFKGGLQANLITDDIAYEFSKLRIKELWLACDCDSALPGFVKAVKILYKHGFNRNKIHCYCLIGDNMEKNEARLKAVYEAGAMPFAQLYQPIGIDNKKTYSTDWRQFQRQWSRPAATRAHCERGTSFTEKVFV